MKQQKQGKQHCVERELSDLHSRCVTEEKNLQRELSSQRPLKRNIACSRCGLACDPDRRVLATGTLRATAQLTRACLFVSYIHSTTEPCLRVDTARPVMFGRQFLGGFAESLFNNLSILLFILFSASGTQPLRRCAATFAPDSDVNLVGQHSQTTINRDAPQRSSQKNVSLQFVAQHSFELISVLNVEEENFFP